MKETPPSIDAALEPFFAAARDIPVLAAAPTQRILERVAGVAAASAAAPALTGLTAKAAIVIGAACMSLGAGVGGGLVWSLTSEEVAPGHPSKAKAEAAPVPTLDTALDEPEVVPESRSIRQERAPEHERSTLAAERRLLEAARAALSRGRPGNASSALARHQRRFPRGELAEERAILEVETAFAHRAWEEVESRGRRFSAEHPDSLYRARVLRLRRQARGRLELPEE